MTGNAYLESYLRGQRNFRRACGPIKMVVPPRFERGAFHLGVKGTGFHMGNNLTVERPRTQ
jgi:hypothetical protein